MKHSFKIWQSKTSFAFFLFFLCSPLFGEEKTFPPGEIKSIIIKVIHLDLKAIKGKSTNWTIKWNGNLSFQLDEGLLTIESNKFNSKKAWSSKSSKPVTLEISGPAVPVKLFSLSSKSSFSSWTEPVFISSLKGSITGSKNEGPWELSLKEGKINIHRHQGPLTIKSFRAHFILSSSKGSSQFHINEGHLTVKKSEGELNFTTDKAEINLTQFKGSLKGFSQSGKITASIQPETVDLFSGEGAIRIHCIGQAPEITAYTERGKIYGPKYFHKIFSGKSTKVSGRIRGPSKKGTVSLKSDTANIYFN